MHNLQAVKTITPLITNEINNYINGHLEDKTALLRLAILLKQWANPQSNYQSNFTEDELNENFPYLHTIITEHETMFAKQKFTPEEKIQIIELIRIHLNSLANDIIKQYDLITAFQQNIPHDDVAIHTWWNQKTDEEKKKIKQQYKELTDAQKTELSTRTSPKSTVSILPDDPSLFYLYWMCCYHTHLTYCVYQPLFANTAMFGAKVIGHVVSHAGGSSHHAGGFFSFIGHCINEIFKFDHRVGIIASAIIGLLSLIGSGIAGGLYALKKAFNSVTNFLTGNKMLRSLFRWAA